MAWAAAEGNRKADDTSDEFTGSTEDVGNVGRTGRNEEKLSKAEKQMPMQMQTRRLRLLVCSRHCTRSHDPHNLEC